MHPLMRISYLSAIIILVCAMFAVSCKNQSGNDAHRASVVVAPLQETLYTASQLDSTTAVSMLDSVIAAYPFEITAAMKVMGYDSVSVKNIYELAHTPAVEIFAPAAIELAPDNASISSNVANILTAADDNGVDLTNYRFATTVWGKPQSILFCDSVMIIGLNHYLGADYDGYRGMDEYRRASKTPEALPYDMAEALVATTLPYIATDDASTINRMIYEGTLTEAKMRLVADADPASALGYTSEQYQSLLENEKWIWNKMITEGMVFDHDPTTALRLVSPAPVCSMISPECPGRVGRFIGYRIVRAYLDSHPETKLSELLSPDFYGVANPLIIIGYKPQ